MALPPILSERLRIPVIASPLFIISGPELVIAQCKAGVVGSFPALNARPVSQLDEWLAQITEELAAWDAKNPDRLSAPFAMNQIVHKTNDRLEQDVEMAVKYKVPITITSLGAREDVNQAMHSYGGIVLHDVINDRFARKAVEKGADGLIPVAAGAGGHAGHLSPFALVQELREWFEGPIALSGSIANGAAVLGAQAMGADLAYIGSAFIATQEARAMDGYKDMIVASRGDDIVYSNLFTGVHGNYLRPSIEAAGLDPDNLPEADPSKMNFGSDRQKPKAWKEIWGCGQGIGVLDSIPRAGELVERLATEYHAARSALLGHASPVPAREAETAALQAQTHQARRALWAAARTAPQRPATPQQTLAAVQSRLTRTLRQEQVEYGYSYTALFNGFSVRTARKNLEAIRNTKGVTCAFVAGSYALPTTQQADTQALQVALASSRFTGKGMTIAVLDTGLDTAHPAFANAPADAKFTKDYISGVLQAADLNAEVLMPGVTADDVYISAKIPFAFDYAGKDAQVAPGSKWDAENLEHGTHVAGIAAGYAVDGEGAVTFSGVAPDAQVIPMKVFDDSGTGAATTTILAALEDAYRLGVDAVNLSLGSYGGFTVDEDALINDVYNKLDDAGIMVITAAGNETSSSYMNSYGTDAPLTGDPDNSVVAAPSVYPANLSIASVEGQEVYANYVLLGDEKITATATSTT